jgi:hypothetical protein
MGHHEKHKEEGGKDAWDDSSFWECACNTWSKPEWKEEVQKEKEQ